MSNDMKSLIKSIAILSIVLVLAYLLSFYFGSIYEYFFPKNIGGGGVFSIPHNAGIQLRGLSLAYIFFLTLLFTAFGGSKKYWWIGVLLIPAAVFEIYFDLEHIYFPLALGVIGWAFGFLIQKFLPR